jgi:rieske iron-sulfur protein
MGQCEESESSHRAVRRAMLRVALTVGASVPLGGLCPWRAAIAQGGDPKSLRPQAGDRFVRQSGERPQQPITTADLPEGGPPLVVYPMDPGTSVVRDGSRLNQVLLVRIGAAELTDETRSRAADGIVAYSGVCTHAGCDVVLWKPEVKRFRCPCHESEFDPKDSGRVVGGPAPRRLPRLPVKVVDGMLIASGDFMGRPGFQTG